MKRNSQIGSSELQKETKNYYVGSFLYFGATGKKGIYVKQEQFLYKKQKSHQKVFSKDELTESEGTDTSIDNLRSILIPNQISEFITKITVVNLIEIALFVNKSKQIKQNHNILQFKCRCGICVVQLRIDIYLTNKIFNMDYIEILEDARYYENCYHQQKRIVKNLRNRNRTQQITDSIKIHNELIKLYLNKQNQIFQIHSTHTKNRNFIPALFQLFNIRKNFPALIKPKKAEKKMLFIENLRKMINQKNLSIYIRNRVSFNYYLCDQEGVDLLIDLSLFQNQIIQDENIPLQIKQINKKRLESIQKLLQQKKQVPNQVIIIPIDVQQQGELNKITKQQIEEQLSKKSLQLEKKIDEENKYYQQCNVKLNYQLYDFQKKAITWMMYRQGRLALNQIFERDFQNKEWIKQYQRKISPYYEEIVFPNNQSIYFNQTDKCFKKKFKQEYNHVKGGILADQMGLGKTITTIGLIIQDSYQKNKGSNLIITPLSVINQWQKEITKFSPKQLNVFCYHEDTNKNKNKVDLSQYDVVITTYSTLVGEYKKYQINKTNKRQQKYLFDYKWRRIILDEAHNIKNRATITAKAAFALNSQFRWCLTGTPLQNNTAQLFSLFKFLRVQSFSQWHWWNQHIQKAQNDLERYLIIHKIIRPILLRRLKSKVLDLPPKILMSDHPLQFSPNQRQLYKVFERRSKLQIKDILQDQQTKNKFPHIYQIVLRLRQLCCHPKLVFKKQNLNYWNYTQQIGAYFVRSPELNQKIQSYKNGQPVNCPYCDLIPAQLVQYQCSHVFCLQCSPLHVENQKKCPECKRQINLQKIRPILVQPLDTQKLDVKSEQLNIESSTKLTQIFRIIGQVQDRNQKCIVYSQWVTFLDLMSKTCRKNNIKYCTITGSVPKVKRTEQIKIFQEDSSISVMFISLRAGAHGLNLTMANNIILADPWWNPALQNQAIDRLHRIGQTKDVKIYRLIVKDTTQERLLEIHQRKTKQLNYTLMKTQNKKQNLQSIITSFFGQADLSLD